MIKGVLLVILQSRSIRWVINIDFISFLWNLMMKGTFYAIVYWTMMISIYLICLFLIWSQSSVFSQISDQWSVVLCITTSLNQSRNYIRFHFQCLSTSALEHTRLPLHLNSEQKTTEQYQGSAKCGLLDLNTVLNCQIQVN